MSPDPKTPESIVSHEADYKKDAWKAYTVDQLGQWVARLHQRAGHRSGEKMAKDLSDAQAYLDMMQAHLDALRE